MGTSLFCELWYFIMGPFLYRSSTAKMTAVTLLIDETSVASSWRLDSDFGRKARSRQPFLRGKLKKYFHSAHSKHSNSVSVSLSTSLHWKPRHHLRSISHASRLSLAWNLAACRQLYIACYLCRAPKSEVVEFQGIACKEGTLRHSGIPWQTRAKWVLKLSMQPFRNRRFSQSAIRRTSARQRHIGLPLSLPWLRGLSVLVFSHICATTHLDEGATTDTSPAGQANQCSQFNTQVSSLEPIRKAAPD